MTATVSEDAELSFWSSAALDSLLRRHPEFCMKLLNILGEKMTAMQQMQRAMLGGERATVTQTAIV